MDETKKCKVCGQEKPLGEFRRNHLSFDGHTDTCMVCITAKRRLNEDAELPTGSKVFDPRFSQFQSRELIAELRRRGYKGTLQFTQEITV